MYGYPMDRNPEEGIYSLNFEAGHRTFVKTMGNVPIYNGGKNENFKIQFLARKIYQYGSTLHQKMQNSNILGGMFKKKMIF